MTRGEVRILRGKALVRFQWRFALKDAPTVPEASRLVSRIVVHASCASFAILSRTPRMPTCGGGLDSTFRIRIPFDEGRGKEGEIEGGKGGEIEGEIEGGKRRGKGKKGR